MTLPSSYLLSFGLILLCNDRLAVEGMRLLKRNLCGSENLEGGGFGEREVRVGENLGDQYSEVK